MLTKSSENLLDVNGYTYWDIKYTKTKFNSDIFNLEWTVYDLYWIFNLLSYPAVGYFLGLYVNRKF